MKPRTENAVANTATIRAALENDRLRLALQPVVDAKTRAPAFYECLLRIEEPDGTALNAGGFVEEAERAGLVTEIDRRTLDLAIPLLRQRPDIALSVNMSALTTGDRAWLDALSDLTGNETSLTRRLTIEITETAAIRDFDETARFVDRLHDIGCTVALDDFGAGQTSFRHLTALRLDMLKIDGTIIAGLPADRRKAGMAKAMIEMAKAFELTTVAEWVIDEACAGFLSDAGVTYLQGELTGMPMSPASLPQIASQD